jgi:hypothetical protein
MRFDRWVWLLSLVVMVSCQGAVGSGGSSGVVPFSTALYDAGADGGTPGISVFLNEGSPTGKPIQGASVTLDGLPLVWSASGYYQLTPAPVLVAGAVHTLRLSAPGVFPATEVSAAVPSGAPPNLAVNPAPPSGWAERNTTLADSYQVSPLAGAWPADPVVVWTKLYGAGYLLATISKALPTPGGSTAVSSSAPVGQGAHVGFEVRRVALVPIPGLAPGSRLRIEGADASKVGFDPLTDLSPFHVTLTVEKAPQAPGTTINASVQDTHWAVVAGGSLTVDAVPVPATSAGAGTYYRYDSTAWAEGSVHQYSFTTPDGKVHAGSFTTPVGTLTGVTYSPTKADPVAAAYTAFPPGTTWPAGSHLSVEATVNGSVWETSRDPAGTSPAVFGDTFLAQASLVTFRAALRTSRPIPGCLSPSFVSASGPWTSW